MTSEVPWSLRVCDHYNHMSGPGDIPVSCSSTWGPGLQGPFACVFSRSCPFPWASGILFWHHCPLLADLSALSFPESPLHSTHRGSLGVGHRSYFFLSNTHLDFPSPAWIFPETSLMALKPQCHGAGCPLPKRSKTLSKTTLANLHSLWALWLRLWTDVPKLARCAAPAKGR